MIPVVRRLGQAAVASLAAFAFVSTAHAQSIFDAEYRLAPQWIQYQIHSPVDETVSELAIPLFVSVPAGSRMSFDVGPTLFEWLEKSAPATYAAILEADRLSAARLGHGNAIAMPYHHTILPLASRRDKVTEVRWGIADFRRRFGREPEGMWLPETAVDEETLEVLAEAGIRITVLAPHQVESRSVSGLPLRFPAGGGRELALCIYDAVLSGEIAFGRLLTDGALLASRLAPAVPSGNTAAGRGKSTRARAVELIAAATDGETFGHHHKFGEMALARAFRILADRGDVRIENFASFLAKNPPREDAVLSLPALSIPRNEVELLGKVHQVGQDAILQADVSNPDVPSGQPFSWSLPTTSPRSSR
jgi:hypothetical protein